MTFDDILLVPKYSEILPNEADTTSRITRSVYVKTPLLSAAMDTVTESDLAIAMAQEGGIGVLHKNMPIEAQAAEVRRVKKFETGIIRDPVTCSPEISVNDLLLVTKKIK